MGPKPCVRGRGDGVNMVVEDQDHQGIDGSHHEGVDGAAVGGRDVGEVVTVDCGGDLFHLQGPTPVLAVPEAAVGQMMLLPWQHLA